MRSSVTKIADSLMFLFLGYLFVDMGREGDWIWLISVIVVGLSLMFIFTKGIDWLYKRRRCPSKWMGMFPCQRERGHDSKHMSGPNFQGKTIYWDDIDVTDR